MRYLKYYEDATTGPGGYLHINGERIYITQIAKKYKHSWLSFVEDNEMSTQEFEKLYSRLRNVLSILGIKTSSIDNKIGFNFDLNSIPGSIVSTIIKERLTNLNIYQPKLSVYLYLGPLTKLTDSSIYVSSKLEDLRNTQGRKIITTSSADIAFNLIMKYLIQLLIPAMSRIGGINNTDCDLGIPDFKEIMLLYLGNNSDNIKASLDIRDVIINKDIVNFIHSHIKDSPKLFTIISTIKKNNPILFEAIKKSNLFEDTESTDKLDIAAGMGDLGFS